METITRKFIQITDYLSWIAYIALVAIIIVVSIEVVGRYFFSSPLFGANEIVTALMICMSGFAIMHTTLKHGHVAIDLLTIRFPKNIRAIMQRIIAFIGCITWGLITYRTFIYMVQVINSHETTGNLGIPLAPLVFPFILGIFFSTVILFIQIFQIPEETEELSIG